MMKYLQLRSGRALRALEIQDQRAEGRAEFANPADAFSAKESGVREKGRMDGHFLAIRRTRRRHVRRSSGQAFELPHLAGAYRQKGREGNAPQQDGRRRAPVRPHPVHGARKLRGRSAPLRLLPHTGWRDGDVPVGEGDGAGLPDGWAAARSLHRGRKPEAWKIPGHRRACISPHRQPAAR